MNKYIILLLVGIVTIINGANYHLISDIGTSAKMIGIGNIEGFENNALSLFQNPANLESEKNISIAGFSTKLIDEIVYVNAAISYKLNFGTIAIGFMQASVEEIPHTRKITTGSDIGKVVFDNSYFEYKNTIGKIGYGFDYNKKLKIGSSINYYNNKIDTVVGQGINVDVGVTYTEKKWQLNTVVKNILFFNDITYNNNEKEKAPTQIVISAKYKISEEISAYTQLKTHYQNSPVTKYLGIKYKPKDNILYVSGGYKEILAGIKKKTNISMGLGLELNAINIYFSYDKSEYFQQDNKYYMSISTNL